MAIDQAVDRSIARRKYCSVVNVEDTLKRLGQRIREIRIQRGFASQEALAEYLQVHRTFVGHLETGRKDFRMTTIIRTAEALGVTLSELFDGMDAGRPFKANRAGQRGARAHIAVLRELAVLEHSVEKLRELL